MLQAGANSGVGAGPPTRMTSRLTRPAPVGTPGPKPERLPLSFGGPAAGWCGPEDPGTFGRAAGPASGASSGARSERPAQKRELNRCATDDGESECRVKRTLLVVEALLVLEAAEKPCAAYKPMQRRGNGGCSWDAPDQQVHEFLQVSGLACLGLIIRRSISPGMTRVEGAFP